MYTLTNSVRLIGNLGAAPIVKDTNAGGKVANFSIATRSFSKDKEGNKVEETEWHKIVVWGKQAETVEKYLEKGSQVAVEGMLKTRKYTDKDGIERYSTEIVANDFQMLGSRKSE